MKGRCEDALSLSQARRMSKLCLWSEQVNFLCGGLQGLAQAILWLATVSRERACCPRPPGGFLVESACKLPPN